MTILKTSLLAAVAAIIAVSSANAAPKKVYNTTDFTVAHEQFPSSREAQEKLNW
ncbi:MAG: hypothetical protein HY659_04630 [Rhizobiales bacterium]|nr:hypothetical protein [Hyphomicrobiales bacterium]